ncbi:ABC transporter permease subunit [Leifsonia shinshuensis]|uniref:ABC transporter permease n=1 Tax=Leifsonia shinshuensis TaxID=150026 RepID=UPI0028558A1F|nr:ABC transporter permease subunit [Leifsonia shinshuensis]MDR6972439.1 ABC-2 type transport system permease protein [Leifsonia shinshuensis]
MTTVTTPAAPAATRATAPRSSTAATLAALVRQRLRRDRWQLVIWLLSIAALGAFSAASLQQTYGSAASRVQLIRLAIADPTILVLRGLPQGTTLAALTFFEIFTFLALLAGLMNTFLAVRHSRAEEESGRAELIASSPAGRLLPTTATVIHATLANILLAVLVALGFISTGLPVAGSFVAGAVTGGAGLAFFGVGLLLAQVFSTSRAANGFSAAVVLLAYVLRGIGDAMGTPFGDGTHLRAAWPSWLSPIGWGEQSAAFTADDPRPLLLQVALAAVLVAGVFGLQAVRDSGAGLIAARPGRADASPALGGMFGLAWRLQWPTVVGWTVGGALGGLLAGALGSAINSSLAQNPDLAGIREAMTRIGAGGSGPLTQLFISAIFSIVGVLAAAAAVQCVIRLRQEEASGTAEVLLATPLSRVRWLFSIVAVGLIAIVLVLLAAAVASGLSAVSAGEPASTIGDSFSAAAAQLPVALVYLGVLTLVFVVLPTWTIPVGWAALGLGAFVGIFGGLIKLPEWLRHVSPFADAPVVVGNVDWTGGYWMLGITVAALAGSAALIRRRDFAIG